MLVLRFTVILLIALAASAAAQSGRNKPEPTPTPRSTPRTVPASTPPRERIVTATPTPTPTPSDNEEVIRVDSTLIPIPVSVVDNEGRAIRNLQLRDFEVKINGERVELAEITRAETPVRVALLFDNSGSVLKAREFEVQASVRFFERVIRPDRDLAALFSISTIGRREQPFTADPRVLVDAIRRLPPPEGATALLDTIEMAARYLGDVSGRRVIVIVSDGDDTKTDTPFEQALRLPQSLDCQIFVVHTTEFENYIRTGSRRGNANVRALAAERRMQSFAAQTGGAVYTPIDERELDDAFRRISVELAEQYVLSYYPEELRAAPGEYRSIEVSVKARPDVTVRARKGYYVPKQR